MNFTSLLQSIRAGSDISPQLNIIKSLSKSELNRALFMSAKLGRLDSACLLIQCGACPNARLDESTPPASVYDINNIMTSTYRKHRAQQLQKATDALSRSNQALTQLLRSYALQQRAKRSCLQRNSKPAALSALCENPAPCENVNLLASDESETVISHKNECTKSARLGKKIGQRFAAKKVHMVKNTML